MFFKFQILQCKVYKYLCEFKLKKKLTIIYLGIVAKVQRLIQIIY